MPDTVVFLAKSAGVWLALASVRIMGVSSIERCWMAGALWLSLTVAFEFLFGHDVGGDSWRTLFQAYDVRRGNLWPLVIAVTAVSPYGAAQVRGLV